MDSFINAVIQLTVKILRYVRQWMKVSRTQIPTLEDIPVLVYYFYYTNYDKHKNILSVHFKILSQKGKWHQWISCGRKSWISVILTWKFQGKMPNASLFVLNTLLTCLPSLYDVFHQALISTSSKTKPRYVSVVKAQLSNCWNVRPIITGFSWEKGQPCL